MNGTALPITSHEMARATPLSRGAGDGSPELRLFAALLEDVCFCLAPTTLVDRATRRDAIAWVCGEVDSPAPCSFREICEILDLDEAATRARLLALASGETHERRRRLDSVLRSASGAHRPAAIPTRPAALDAARRRTLEGGHERDFTRA